MSASKTAKVAAKAVEKSQKKTAAERTPEEVIKQIRNNLISWLAVTPSDQRLLLTAYDAAIAEAVRLGIEAKTFEKKLDEALSANIELQKKIDEFREVYEEENRKLKLITDSPTPLQVTIEPITSASAETVQCSDDKEDVRAEIDRFYDDGVPIVE